MPKSQQRPATRPPVGRPRTAPRQVRIIGGAWKRTPLAVLDAEGLRPTPDRVRETVFNWLRHLRDGDFAQARCLDLFAGSGALGLEAASRGAREVMLVEAHVPAVRQLEAVCDKLKAQQVSVVRADALAMVQKLAAMRPASFELIFLDPPYGQGWLEKTLPWCERLLAADGLVYAESEGPLASEPALAWLDNWDIVRSDQAGLVHFHLLRRKIG